MNTKRIEHWPFIWGQGSEQTIAINANVRYLFPEHETPYEAPDLQKLVDDGVDYSIDPDQLGTVDVVMLGREFINELYNRGVDPDEIGQWSKPNG